MSTPPAPGRLWRRLGVVVLAAVVVLDVWVVRAVTADPEPSAAALSGDPGPFGWRPARPATGSTAGRPGELVGPVLLSEAPDGTVLRANLGSCDDKRRPTVGVLEGDEAAVRTVSVPGLGQVTGILADRGRLRIAGLDLRCRATGWTSTDGGRTWARGPVPRIWRLDPDPEATAVLSPRGRVPVTPDCPPSLVATAVDGSAVVTCLSGIVLRLAQPAGVTDVAPTPLTSTFGLRAAAVVGDRTVVGVLSAACPAQVAVVAALGNPQQQPPSVCLARNKAVTGMTATAAGGLLVQAGNDLFRLDRVGAEPRLIGAGRSDR